MMRTFVWAIVGSAIAIIAAPAAAQYDPAPVPIRYEHRGWGEVGELQGRIDNIRRQIDRLDRREAIRGRAADRLLGEADKIERRLHDKARNGLDPREAGDIQYRLQRLEQRVRFAIGDRYGRYAYRG